MKVGSKIAFITWHSPETNYLETLFLPIFSELHQQHQYQFYIIQFSWIDEKTYVNRKTLIEKSGFTYLYFPVSLKPVAAVGKFLTLFKFKNQIQKFLKDQQIDWVMPRSIMPAMLINLLKLDQTKIIFDADGLPIEERLESKVIKKGSFLHKLYQLNEQKIINKAKVVITRSVFANTYLSSKYNKSITTFYKVINGKNTNDFYYSEIERKKIRNTLQVSDSDLVFVYCGSLGAKYELDTMYNLFKNYAEKNQSAKFLILTNSPNQVAISDANVIKCSVPNSQVYQYLSAADVALGIITESKSMKAAAAIKHAEYLMCGLPTILTEVGDILQIENIQPFLLHYNQSISTKKIEDFIEQSRSLNRNNISKIAMQHFSIEKAAQSYHNALCQNK